MDITLTRTVAQKGINLQEYVQQSVKEAAKIITPYWPISTFIASNGLNGLESLPFAQAMQYSKGLRDSQGFLPLSSYREFYAKGRITDNDLENAISANIRDLNLPENLSVGDHQTVSTHHLFQEWLMNTATPQEMQRARTEMWETIARRMKALNPGKASGEDTTVITATPGESVTARDGQTVTEVINRRMITWCAAFVDEGQAAWAMPGREKGFYLAWKALASLDGGFRHYTKKSIAKQIQALPAQPEQALAQMLQQMEIAPEDWAAYLTRHLAQLPGWASLIQWRGEHPEVPIQQQHPINLVEYLAVRVFYETVLLEAQAQSNKGTKAPAIKKTTLAEQNQEALISRLVTLAETAHIKPVKLETMPAETFQMIVTLANRCDTLTQQMIWQEAYENHYRQSLMRNLQIAHQKVTSVSRKTPAAQAVFCIDVRSEGLRRNLEKQGAYETYGFAGFFGVPMLYQPLGSSCNMTVAPALITPAQVVREVPKAGSEGAVERRLSFNRRRYTAGELLHTMRENLLTPFAFVEMAGWASFFPLLGKTIAPGAWRKAKNAVQEKLTPPVATEPSIVANPAEMSIEAQAGAVAGMLKAIGLTKDFAKLIFLFGHGSETENNPYASALDCGACGGNHGGTSAALAASILNTRAVRKVIAEQGLIIPDETWFIGGEHNTTTDTVSLIDEELVPQSHKSALEQFKRDLAEAGELNARDRLLKLPGATGEKAAITAVVEQRAADWAQVRPEWGLVRNAAFICGRRSLTANLNLDNRVFLHSYDPNLDPEGAVLEVIMTAPVVVAEWINMQYYLSTVDNQRFGSSTKLLHTVVGQVGVMQGRQSDLLVGLPQQSVMLGDELFHEPLRLCVILEAPRARIKKIIDKHAGLQNLTHNKWISLVSYESSANVFYQYTPQGEWVEIDLNSAMGKDNEEEVAA